MRGRERQRSSARAPVIGSDRNDVPLRLQKRPYPVGTAVIHHNDLDLGRGAPA